MKIVSHNANHLKNVNHLSFNHISLNMSLLLKTMMENSVTSPQTLDKHGDEIHSPVQAVYIQSNSPYSERTVLIPFYGWSWILYYCCRRSRSAGSSGSDNYKAVKSDD